MAERCIRIAVTGVRLPSSPPSQMEVIKKIGLAILRDKKILMTRGRGNDVYYFIGGKTKEGESDMDCLRREVKEELCADINKESIKYLHEFEVEAWGKPGVMVHMRLYTGKLLNEPKPCTEVEEIKYFDSSIDPKLITPLTKETFNWLKRQKLIS